MHIMFVHPDFPGPFASLAHYLQTQAGWDCTVITSIDTTGQTLPYNHLNYRLMDQEQAKTFKMPVSLQEMMEHLGAIYCGLRSVPQLQPDLVVGHTFFGTMLYLRNLYRCPFIGYYEFMPPPFWSEQATLRPDYPPSEGRRLVDATLHALNVLHLHAVDAAYTPSQFQLQTAPVELRSKIRVLGDGIDVDLFQPRASARPVTLLGTTIDADTRVVTYVSEGLDSVHGFDIFMKAAKLIYEEVPNVVFFIVGAEHGGQGHELDHIGGQSFKAHVLSQDSYEMERFRFLDSVAPSDLATLFNLSDLHMCLTVPYPLSSSLLAALASGCTLLASATAPVHEVVDDRVHGLLADFHDVDAIADHAIRVLSDPAEYRPLGEAARARVLDSYEQATCRRHLVDFFKSVAGKGDAVPARVDGPQIPWANLFPMPALNQ